MNKSFIKYFLIALATNGSIVVIVLLLTYKPIKPYNVNKEYRKSLYTVDQKTQAIIDSLKADSNLMIKIKKQAIRRDYTVPKMLVNNAQFILKTNEKENLTLIKEIERIKGNDKWLKEVKIKAKQRGFTLEEMIVREAKYIMNQKNKNEQHQ